MTAFLSFSVNSGGQTNTVCTCPPTCQTTNYDVTISSAQLSNLYVDEAVYANVSHRYSEAIDVKSRVDISVLSSVLKALVKLLSAEKTLKAAITVNIVDRRTSVTGQLYESITTLVQTTQDCLESFSTDLLRTLNIDANMSIASSLNDASSWVKNVLPMNDSLPLVAVDRQAIVDQIGGEIGWLQLVIDKYNSRNMTTVSLVLILSGCLLHTR